MKKILAGILIVVTVLIMTGCDEITTGNRVTAGRDVQTFQYCYINLGENKIKEGYVTQWRDYSNSDVVQVLVDGCYYLTHYTNVILVADPKYGSVGFSNSKAFGIDE